MCGIGGYLLAAESERPRPEARRLLMAVAGRGPDGDGMCLASRDGRTLQPLRTDAGPTGTPETPHLHDARFPHDVALVHTRYAVIDRTAGGHQPFISGDGSVAATFNGEVYNYRELRDRLEREGVAFRTRSDTEVLVEAYRAWGHDVWNRLNGFWAVALVDLREGTLVLSRDRPGIAPLYVREDPGMLRFSSLLRPLHNGLDDMDPERARAFIDTGLKDFDPRTFYRSVRSLPAATTVVLPPGAVRLDDGRRIEYWRAPSTVLTASDLSVDEAADAVRETLADAVHLRLRSDRPIAFELSGGLDSSSLVALAARALDRPLTTYTLRVPEADEEPFARSLRDRFRLDYRVLDDVEAPFADHAVAFAALMEEPYHAPSIYTHFRIRQRIKEAGSDVVVTGSGGDEVLAGYEWDFWPAAKRLLRADGARLEALRSDLAMRYGTRERAAHSIAGWARWVVRSSRHPIALLRRAIGRLRQNDAAAAGRPRSRAEQRREDPAYSLLAMYPSLDYVEQRHYHLRVAHLPYYLRSNDHFTFSLPLEHRFPFLDHRVIELGLRMPPAYLFRNGWTKYILRKAMDGLLPDSVVWRREKLGFPFPFQRFLRENRPAFACRVERAMAAGVMDPIVYGDLLRRDHHRLWRICSTGFWLEALDGSPPVVDVPSSSRMTRS